MQAPAAESSEDAASKALVVKPRAARPRPGLDLAAIIAARERLRGHIIETPCEPSRELGLEAGGARVFLKRDHLQATGSFKERGAANALLVLGREARAGVVAASAGNHALGLARHGARLGVPVTLVMPRGAAQAKVARCRKLGAEVALEGGSFDEAEDFARDLARRRGAVFVHPFDDEHVMAGQGTMALEILRQTPEVDAIVVPVGGGGLLAGVIAAVKALRPEVEIHAVEPSAAASFDAARRRGQPVRVAVDATFADGLAVARVGALPFAVSEGRVDGSCVVSEEEIAWAMLRLFEVERTAVEGAGATALAALLAGKLPSLAGKNVVVPVCGANVDATTFARALHLGLARRARGARAVAV